MPSATGRIEKHSITASVWRDETTRPYSYVVEAIDNANDSAVILTRFYEPDAKARAIEYAQEKYLTVEIR